MYLAPVCTLSRTDVSLLKFVGVNVPSTFMYHFEDVSLVEFVPSTF